MKKFLLFIATLSFIIPYFVQANNNGSIEKNGDDIILTYDNKTITIYNKDVDSYLNCPNGYSMRSKEQISNIIKMRYDIKGNEYEYLNLKKSNSSYWLNEERFSPGANITAGQGLGTFTNDLNLGWDIYKTKDYPTFFSISHRSNYVDYPHIGTDHTINAQFINCGNVKYVQVGFDQVECSKIKQIQKTRCIKNEEKQEQKSENLDNNFSKDYNDAYLFAYENKITTMPTIEEASMTGEIIRAEIAKMFSNWMKSLGYELNTQKQCKFSDTKSVQGDLAPAIIESCQFGVMGQGITKFRPFDKITKGEVATAVSRIIRGDKYNGGEPFYVNHINTLIQEGVIDNADNVNENELRGNVMLMLMKANEVIKNNKYN